MVATKSDSGIVDATKTICKSCKSTTVATSMSIADLEISEAGPGNGDEEVTFIATITNRRVDGLQYITMACFVVTTSFWLTTVAVYHPRPWPVMQNALISLAICFVLNQVAVCLLPDMEDRYILMHFALGLLQNMVYIGIFAANPDCFIQIWTSVYFGYYLWTWIMLITQPHKFFHTFRVFYLIHHTVSFIITGTWILISPCCFDDDNNYIYLAIVIWLSADLWNYSLNCFRSLRKTDKDVIRKAQTVVFFIERIQRIVAYFMPLTVPAEQHNTFMWIVLGTGIANDVLDAGFQAHSLSKYYYYK